MKYSVAWLILIFVLTILFVTKAFSTLFIVGSLIGGFIMILFGALDDIVTLLKEIKDEKNV